MNSKEAGAEKEELCETLPSEIHIIKGRTSNIICPETKLYETFISFDDFFVYSNGRGIRRAWKITEDLQWRNISKQVRRSVHVTGSAQCHYPDWIS